MDVHEFDELNEATVKGWGEPFYTDDTVTLWHGDSLEVLSELPNQSVNCCVTSPPYFGLRDYGIEGQYGLESSPAEYVETMRALFADVRRVLADDGTLWLNIGDSYSAKRTYQVDGTISRRGAQGVSRPYDTTDDRPAKNLLGIPWRVAFALQDDDSADIYELLPGVPADVRARAVEHLETCRTKIPSEHASTAASTRSDGVKPTPSDTPSVVLPGTQQTATNSASTAGATTNSTASKKSSAPSEATSVAIAASDSLPCSTTEASSPSVGAAENGVSTFSRSTTSTAVGTRTEQNSAKPTSTSGSTCVESPTPTVSASSATTATAQSAGMARVRTPKSVTVRLLRAEIPEGDLEHYRLVKQDRWILRNDVIWAKPNAMPESVTDRLATKHEHLFMFAKSRRYWFDLDPIRDEYSEASLARYAYEFQQEGATYQAQVKRGAHLRDGGKIEANHQGKNPGDVWSIPTQPYPDAHFAVMPQALASRAIQAGCKPGGTVLDPFSGSGTTGLAAAKHGRRYVGIDLNAEYLELSLKTRLSQPALVDVCDE